MVILIRVDEVEGRVLTILCNVLGKHSQPIGVGVKLPGNGPVWLRLTTKDENAQFSYSLKGENFEEIGGCLDATVISDDYYLKINQSRFTGAFVGVCCQDLSRQSAYADFDFFEYKAII